MSTSSAKVARIVDEEWPVISGQWSVRFLTTDRWPLTTFIKQLRLFLRRLLIIFIDEVRDADTREAVAALRRKVETRQELRADSRQVVAARWNRLGREPPRRGFEIASAQLHRHRASDQLFVAERFPEFLRFFANVLGDLVERDVLRERVLARPRLPLLQRHHRRLVDAARQLPKARAPFAEARHELVGSE